LIGTIDDAPNCIFGSGCMIWAVRVGRHRADCGHSLRSAPTAAMCRECTLQSRTNSTNLPVVTISNAAILFVIADIGALPQHY